MAPLTNDDRSISSSAPSGTRLPVTPKFKATATARYSWPRAATVKAHVQGELTYQGSAPSSLRTDIVPVGPDGSCRPERVPGQIHAATLVDLFAGSRLAAMERRAVRHQRLRQAQRPQPPDGLRQLHARPRRSRPAANDRPSRGDEVLATAPAGRALSSADRARCNGASSRSSRLRRCGWRCCVGGAGRWTARSTRHCTPATGRGSPRRHVFTALGEPTVLIGARRRLRAVVVASPARRLALVLLLIVAIGRGAERSAEILGRARTARPRAAPGRRQDLVLPERPCGQLDDLLPGAGAGADRRHALAARRPRQARCCCRC